MEDGTVSIMADLGAAAKTTNGKTVLIAAGSKIPDLRSTAGFTPRIIASLLRRYWLCEWSTTLAGDATIKSRTLLVMLSRGADVTLKERRRLVLVVREAPLHAGHLRSMLAATENGAMIVPPVPAFYHRPKTIDDVINQTVGRCLDLFDVDVGLVKRWPTEP
jgi:polyprenyl P-hydroxybenzoate/phenylacrylic acid decarboxylase-like protein